MVSSVLGKRQLHVGADPSVMVSCNLETFLELGGRHGLNFIL